MKNLKYKISLLLMIFLLVDNSHGVYATTLNGQVEQSELSGQAEQSRLRIQRGQNNLSGQIEGNLLQSSVLDTMPPVAPRRLYPLYPVAVNTSNTCPSENNLLRSSVSDTMPPMLLRKLCPLTPNSGNSRTYPLNANHGQAFMGVLGCQVTQGNWVDAPRILCIFPACDLNNLDVQVGDQITNIDGHHLLDGGDLLRRAVGVPGTIMNLTISRNGVKRTFPVRRIDARTVAQYDSQIGSNHYHEVAAMTRSW